MPLPRRVATSEVSQFSTLCPTPFSTDSVAAGEGCFALDAVVEKARSGDFLQVNAVQGVGDNILLDRRAIAGHEDSRVVIEEIQTRASDAQAAEGDVIGGDRDDLAHAGTANFRAGIAHQRERFVDHDCARVYAGFHPNSIVRRSRVDFFLERGGSNRIR